MDSSDSLTPDRGGPRKRWHAGFLTAGAVVAMVLAGLGVAGAQTDDTPTTTAPAQSSQAQGGEQDERCRTGHPLRAGLEVAAKAIGITVEELREALRDGQSIAQVAQSKDVEPQKVIDAMVAAAQEDLPERITALVNCEGLGKHGPGRGHHKGHRPGRGPGVKASFGVAAEAIGISEEELLTALRNGQSIAQVAQSNDVDPQKVIDAMVADAKERLAERVEAGDLTQAQADEKLANLTERIANAVDREGLPARGPGSGLHPGPGSGPRPASATA